MSSQNVEICIDCKQHTLPENYCLTYQLCDTCIKSKRGPSKDDKIRALQNNHKRGLIPPIYFCIYDKKGNLERIDSLYMINQHHFLQERE